MPERGPCDPRTTPVDPDTAATGDRSPGRSFVPSPDDPPTWRLRTRGIDHGRARALSLPRRSPPPRCNGAAHSTTTEGGTSGPNSGWTTRRTWAPRRGGLPSRLPAQSMPLGAPGQGRTECERSGPWTRGGGVLAGPTTVTTGRGAACAEGAEDEGCGATPSNPLRAPLPEGRHPPAWPSIVAHHSKQGEAPPVSIPWVRGLAVSSRRVRFRWTYSGGSTRAASSTPSDGG